jgi:hypothetical protein
MLRLRPRLFDGTWLLAESPHHDRVARLKPFAASKSDLRFSHDCRKLFASGKHSSSPSLPYCNGTRAQRLAGYCGYDNFYPGLGKLGRLRRCRCCLTDGCRRSEKKDNSRGPDVRVEIEDVQSKIKTGAR